MKTISIKDIIIKYNEYLDEALKYNYLVRDIDQQKEQIKKLTLFVQEIKYYKSQAIHNENKPYANTFFHFQCVLNSLISILNMWVELKNNKNKEAWNKLIDAQEYLSVAMRIECEQFGLKELLNVYEKIESVLFPGWNLYNSSAFIEKGGKCSICISEYAECDHLEGLVYMGRLCRIVERKPVVLDHTAMVEHPRDKRCIIEWISTDDGRKRDYMTWKILDEKVKNANGGMVMGGVIDNFNELDYD
ncbi:MAG: hypothetical protein QQN55_08415 [Nitrosopumilus sp.]